jgi:hypothetical protein
LLPDVSAGRTARELWWTSQELSSADINITMILHAHISPGGMTLVAAVMRQYHPLDIINQSINIWFKEVVRSLDYLSLNYMINK